ncbi:MAG: 30S ribosomal protein S18 [Legionella sp. 21-45-4]|nr:MAG: 30S ribosomal protein S18 [Legionella sp. 21-45-4]
MSTYFRRKKIHRASGEQATQVDYKDLGMLKNYISETGKIIPCRITGIPTRMQRQVSNSIKLARFLALMPYCDSHK